MADLRASIRLQRDILRSLGFACVEEEPNFPSPVAESSPDAAASAPPRMPAPTPQPTRRPRDDRFAAPLSRDERRSDEQRRSDLAQVASEVTTCRRCDLHLMRTRAVAGEGSPSARLFVIGELPSEDDDQAGAPFRGGELETLMTNILKAIGFKREEVFVTHAVKCRPPQGRSPNESELECCHEFLARQVQAIRPEVIVCFGQAALQSLMAEEESRILSKCRGRWLDYRDIAVMPTFALPYIARNTDRKRVVWADLQLVMKRLGG